MINEGVMDVDLFFTHCHYDHIIGLPFFKAIYYPSINVDIWSGHLDGKMSTQGNGQSVHQPAVVPRQDRISARQR